MSVFSGSPRIWNHRLPDVRDAQHFARATADALLSPIILHAPYLVNLASPDSQIRRRSLDAMNFQLRFASLCKIPMIVLHPGSHKGSGLKVGIRQCAESIDQLIDEFADDSVLIALETTAGAGNAIGDRFEHLRDIIGATRMRDRLRICVDTCHIFAAGYDLRDGQSYEKTFGTIDRVLGLHMISVIHLNDSRTSLGSRRDRHSHIGKGFIGIKGFSLLINDARLSQLPMILETPKGARNEMDQVNLSTLRSL